MFRELLVHQSVRIVIVMLAVATRILRLQVIV